MAKKASSSSNSKRSRREAARRETRHANQAGGDQAIFAPTPPQDPAPDSAPPRRTAGVFTTIAATRGEQTDTADIAALPPETPRQTVHAVSPGHTEFTPPTPLPATAADPQSHFVWTRKDLLGLDDLSAQEIVHILDTAESFREVSTRSIKKLPTLRGKVVALLFFEDSTRTRMSFELAASRLGADTLLFTSRGSSVTKGETTLDTVRNIQAMGVDIFVIRHGQSGAPHLLARQVNSSIVNAGDGQHEHPTQALLDMFTMRQRLGRIEGLRVALVGDIAHSRVARSNILGLKKLGAEVVVVGPPTLVPAAIRSMGCEICDRLDDVLEEVDVINMLRIQFERFSSNLFPSVREYSRLYGLNGERLKRCKPNVLVMHPGPINRGVELTSDVADGPNSCILQQVTNGLAIRMAVLYMVSQNTR